MKPPPDLRETLERYADADAVQEDVLTAVMTKVTPMDEPPKKGAAPSPRKATRKR